MKKKLPILLMICILLLSLPSCSFKKENSKEEQKESMQTEKAAAFPEFEGKDLNGNMVNSTTLFSEHSVTVVNFWSNTCPACIGELSTLDKLNKDLEAKGGTVIGINVDTLDENQEQIATAQDLLTKNNASFQNIYFVNGSEAKNFANRIPAYPTAYVIDKNGRIVGEAVVGSVANTRLMEKLQMLIQEAMKAES